MRNDINALVAKVVGGVLLLIGILGFVPGLLINNALFGIFGVNVLHNFVHLLSGVALLAVGFVNNGVYARLGNQIFGVVYLLVTLIGFVAPGFTHSLIAIQGDGTVPAVFDNVLHLLLAIVFLGVGFGVRATGPATARRA